jgi:predicted enzyme related to lactoylglutathione lyase
MKKFMAFFEIPAADFKRAVGFYEAVFNTQLPIMECEHEKMAFFKEGSECVGAVSWSETFPPSEKGVLISFNCEDIEQTHHKVLERGGRIVIPKTKIEAEGKGFFSVVIDSEGNSIGLYADR